MEIDIKSWPPKMSCPGALYVQNVLNCRILEPRKPLVVEKILLPTHEDPNSEWGDGCNLTPQKNLSKPFGTFHSYAPQLFELFAAQAPSVPQNAPRQQTAPAKISPHPSMISHVHEVSVPLLKRRRIGKGPPSKWLDSFDKYCTDLWALSSAISLAVAQYDGSTVAGMTFLDRSR